MQLKPVRNQVIVVTGASSGIGVATARRAARGGASVFLISRNEEALARRCAEITEAGGRADYAAADVGDEAQLRAAANRALERFGRIDTWAHVAGVGIYAPLLETPRPEHERLFRTNYWGVVNASSIAIPHLRGGRERSAREHALEHSLYTDATLLGGTATKFVVVGLAAAAGLAIAAIAGVRPRAARAGWRGASAPTGSTRRASA